MAIAITVFQGLYLNLLHPWAVGGGGVGGVRPDQWGGSEVHTKNQNCEFLYLLHI